MVMHAETSDLSTVEPCELLGALDLPQHRAAARWFNVSSRAVRRWRQGSRRTPRGAAILLRLLVTQVLTADQIEQAAASIPARTNGRAPPEPPAPVAPAPKQSTLAHASAAALAICALEPATCHWPLGDPQHANFCFCGRPADKGRPYCERHYVEAYVAPLVDLVASKRFAHFDFGSRRDLRRAIGRGGHLIEGGAEPIAR
jgi:hypothetical protein